MSFKRNLLSLLLLLGLSLPLMAQYTTVTATVTDPNSNPYAGGRVTAALSSRQPFNNTNSYPPNTAVSALDQTGSFTLTLVDNTQQQAPQPQWVFTVCAADGKTCFSTAQTISGTNQNLSTALSALAPPYFSLGQPTGMPMEFYKQTSATQTGAMAPVTMLTPTSNINAWVDFRLTQVAAGTGCTTNTTVTANIIYTDPLSSSTTSTSVMTFTIPTNGSATTPIWPTSAPNDFFGAKSGTPIQFSTTWTPGTCTTTPTYQLTTVLEVW